MPHEDLPHLGLLTVDRFAAGFSLMGIGPTHIPVLPKGNRQGVFMTSKGLAARADPLNGSPLPNIRDQYRNSGSWLVPSVGTR